MKHLLWLLFTVIPGVLFSQQEVLSKIPKTGQNISAFIPEGYDTLEVATGDLNKDGVVDVALALMSKQEGRRAGPEDDSEVDPTNDEIDLEKELPQRLLVILFGKGNAFELEAVSDSALLCKECGGIFGDPFAGIGIEKGVLLIHHYGGSAWRWSYTHKFRYQQNGFYLIGRTSLSYWNVESCEKLDEMLGTKYEDINFVTGDFERKRVSEEECKLLEHKKGKQAKKPLLSLAKFSIGDDM